MRFGASLPDARLKPAVQFLANENAYDPRSQFLERCSEEHEPSEAIHIIPTDYLGNSSPIANLAMKRMLIGAVARAFEPGCSMSWLPILVSAQGRGKSQFAKSLVPRDLFAEMNSDLHTLTKEAYRLHTAWILELPEIDQFFRPQHAEVLKNLITLQVDEIRRPMNCPSKSKRALSLSVQVTSISCWWTAQATGASSLYVFPIPTTSLGGDSKRREVGCGLLLWTSIEGASSGNTPRVS